MMFDICRLNLIRREAVFKILGAHPKQDAAKSTGSGIAARATRPDSRLAGLKQKMQRPYPALSGKPPNKTARHTKETE